MGITLARDLAWVEQQSKNVQKKNALGLRWILKPWSVTCIEAVWKLVSYVAILPSERWTRKILEWNIRGPRKQGRPAYTWEGGCTWIVEAVAYDPWMRSRQDFVFSRCRLIDRVKSCIFFVCLRLKGARSGPASFDFDFDFGFVHTEVVLRHNTQRFAWNYSLRAMYDG